MAEELAEAAVVVAAAVTVAGIVDAAAIVPVAAAPRRKVSAPHSVRMSSTAEAKEQPDAHIMGKVNPARGSNLQAGHSK